MRGCIIGEIVSGEILKLLNHVLILIANEILRVGRVMVVREFVVRGVMMSSKNV